MDSAPLHCPLLNFETPYCVLEVKVHCEKFGLTIVTQHNLLRYNGNTTGTIYYSVYGLPEHVYLYYRCINLTLARFVHHKLANLVLRQDPSCKMVAFTCIYKFFGQWHVQRYHGGICRNLQPGHRLF